MVIVTAYITVTGWIAISQGTWEEGCMGPGKEGPALSHSPSYASLTSVAPGLDSRA